MPKKFTVQDIMNKEPCPDYTEEVVTELWAGREELTFKEVCNLDIAIDDRVWISARLVPIEIAVKWADYCADEAQKHASYAAYYAASAASATSAYAYAAAIDADAAYWAADAAATTAAAYWAADADWTKTRNEELERFLSKLVEMHEAE